MAELGLESDCEGAPADIHLSSQAFDISFHPSRDVLATGEVEGTVVVHSYSVADGNRVLLELNHHKKSCRALSFSPDGQYLFTASKDKSLQAVDMDTGSVAHCIRKAHSSPVYCMKVVNENIIATGDDDGCIKLWDRRKAANVMELKENEDFISDMTCDPENKTLLAASGDGSLSVVNVRRQKLENQSDNMENELLSIAVVKGGSKVVCGGGDGTLNIFSWGEWGDISDRFPGHPISIDACVAISNSVVCTGSIDGLVRAVHILPNKLLGTVGEHEDFPIDRIRLSHDGCVIGSCSHDQRVKFWNISHLKDVTLDAASSRQTDKQEDTCDNFFADL